jgi:hypothetical protein
LFDWAGKFHTKLSCRAPNDFAGNYGAVEVRHKFKGVWDRCRACRQKAAAGSGEIANRAGDRRVPTVERGYGAFQNPATYMYSLFHNAIPFTLSNP